MSNYLPVRSARRQVNWRLKIGNFKIEEKARELSERLLDYGVEGEQDLSKLIDETGQLSNIIAKSIITAKEGK